MTETHSPPLRPDHWAAVLADEIARRRPDAPSAFDLHDLEILLRAAEERSKPRTQLPSQFHRFPLSWGPLQRLALVFLKRLFHDQRAVNTVLIQALRETLAVNRHLLQELAARREDEA